VNDVHKELTDLKNGAEIMVATIVFPFMDGGDCPTGTKKAPCSGSRALSQ